MSTSVYVINGDGGLMRLDRSDYDSEDLLQRLLADHPAVLDITGDSDGSLLLVRREQGVPGDEAGGDVWSLDHLFIDRSAVPVLVEVKRASNTQIRREVVAQMLDYAANGIAYWPLAQLIAAFERTVEEAGQNAGALLQTFIGEGADPEDFWRQVEANLRSGRIRMIFVADRIPKELRRIVEFLNEQMRPAEVLAVEVEQYLGKDGTRTLVPRLVGATERARSNKAISQVSERLTTDEWLARLAARRGPEAGRGAERALQWFGENGCQVGPTASQDSVSAAVLTEDGKRAWPFFIRMSGNIETSLQYLKNRPAFASDHARQEVLNRLKRLPGVMITTQKLTGWPMFPVSALLRDDLWHEFVELADWIIDRARKAPTNGP